MIDMTKKYRRNGEDGEVITTTARGPHSVIWQSHVTNNVYLFTAEGRNPVGLGPSSPYDLIEVVPDVVWWRRQFLDEDHDRWAQKFGSLANLREREVSRDATVLAILRTTIRNGGRSHTDVSVDVLPVDYKETP